MHISHDRLDCATVQCRNLSNLRQQPSSHDTPTTAQQGSWLKLLGDAADGDSSPTQALTTATQDKGLQRTTHWHLKARRAATSNFRGDGEAQCGRAPAGGKLEIRVQQ